MIENVIDAMLIATELIEKNTKDKVASKINLNNGKHYLLITQKGLKYYVLYKRAFYMTFGREFEKEGQTGIGESINFEYLNYCLKQSVGNILLIYPDGKVYAVSPIEWVNFSVGSNTIRTQKGGEKTYSIPISLLKRWK